MELYSVAFTSSPHKVPNKFRDLIYDQFWCQEEGGLINLIGGNDRFYQGEFLGVGKPLSSPYYYFRLYLTENSKPAGGLVGSQSERKAEVSNLFLGSRTREPQELGNSME